MDTPVLCDAHAHLDDEKFAGRRNEVVAGAGKAGLTIIVNPGSDLESSRQAVELANLHDIVWANCGVHPHDAETWDTDTADEISRLLEDPKAVAVGEIGLDYYWDGPSHDRQKKAFLEQLDLAGRLNLPVVVHCREAFADLEGCLKEMWPRAGVLIHCFSGGVQEARTYLDLGAYISIGGPVTFKNGLVAREVAEYVPANRLLPETDAPYLTPEPFRGRRTNEPALVKHVIDKLAALKNRDPWEMAAVLTANCCAFFGLSLPVKLLVRTD